MDTDGSATKTGGCNFISVSSQLADDVIFLAQSLGGTATKSFKPDRREQYVGSYSVYLNLPEGMNPFGVLSRKALRVKRTHPPGRTITSVTLLDRRPVKCISVAAEDGLYLTDGCIVTHNSAHYEHPELIEAAVSYNTSVQIEISSVNGPATVFQRKRDAGYLWAPGQPLIKDASNVFIFDRSDHPDKTDEWYKREKAIKVNAGLGHIFAQEVDRNPSAAVLGTIIDVDWVRAAVGAAERLGIPDAGPLQAALDVADGDQPGGDRNGLSVRRGVRLIKLQEFGDRDPGATTRRNRTRHERRGRHAHLRGRASRRDREGIDGVALPAPGTVTRR